MKRLFLAVALAATAIAVVGFAGSSAATEQKTIKITIWHGQVDAGEKAMDKLVKRYHALHPDVAITSQQGAPAESMVQKLETVIGTDGYPDIAYVYGSDTPNVAQSPKVVDITADIKATKFDWKSLYEAGRRTATVGKKVVGFPAVIDNLAVVYNKKIFKQAGVKPPTASWTWADYRTLAKRLTNAKIGQYGAGYPIAGSEDTVWRFWPMIWQQGGDALTPDLKKATFAGTAGVRSLQLLADMALKDKSLYADQTADTQKMYGLFGSGKMAMVVTGPWQLEWIIEHKIDYGVQVMPSFDGTNHETISGPDNYVVLNHGDDRRRAAVAFLAWLHEPAQDLEWDLATSNLPLSAKTAALPGVAKLEKTYPGFKLFTRNLANAHHIRPPVPQYTQISTAIGKAIATAMLGRGTPKDALGEAAKKADKALGS